MFIFLMMLSTQLLIKWINFRKICLFKKNTVKKGINQLKSVDKPVTNVNNPVEKEKKLFYD